MFENHTPNNAFSTILAKNAFLRNGKSFPDPLFSIPPRSLHRSMVVLGDGYLPAEFQLSSFNRFSRFNPLNFYLREIKTLNMASVLISVTPFWVYQIVITKYYLDIKYALFTPNGSKVIKGLVSHWFGWELLQRPPKGF